MADADICRRRSRGRAILKIIERVLGGTGWIVMFESYLGGWDRELASCLKSANVCVNCGIQTTNPAALRTAKRFPLDKARFEAVVKWIRQACPKVKLHFELIVGLPGDTCADFTRSLDWTLSLSPDIIVAFHCLILPGSSYWTRRKELEIVCESKPPYRLLRSPSFSAKDWHEMMFRILSLKQICRSEPLRKRLFDMARLNKSRGIAVPHMAALESMAKALGLDSSDFVAETDSANVIELGTPFPRRMEVIPN
jgi:hypothetical protein